MTDVLIIGAGPALGKVLAEKLESVGVTVMPDLGSLVADHIKVTQLVADVMQDMAPPPWQQDRPYLRRKKGRT